MTPNAGFGGNSTMESVVLLVNLIHRAIKEQPQGTNLGRATVEALLREYQAERTVRMRQLIDFSALTTKVQAWENVGYKILSRIVPLLPDKMFALQTANLIKGAPKLDFVPAPWDSKGTVAWTSNSKVPLPRDQRSLLPDSKKGKLLGWGSASLLSVSVLLSFFIVFMGTSVTPFNFWEVEK
jgi:hypothetical protein